MINSDLLMVKINDLRWSYVAGTRGEHRVYTSKEYAQLNEVFHDVFKVIDQCQMDEDDLK